MIDTVIILGVLAACGLLVKHFYVGPPAHVRIQEIIVAFKTEFAPIKDYLDGLAARWRAWADEETKELRAELDAAKAELVTTKDSLDKALDALQAHATDIQDTLSALAASAKSAAPTPPGDAG